MKKQLLLLMLCLCALPLSLPAQIYYHKQPGQMTLLPASVVLPIATIRPDTILTNAERLFPVSTEFRDRVNYVFGPLDKSQVPTGLLGDYGLNLVPPEAYTGPLVDSNRVNMVVWRMLYLSLLSARVHGAHSLPLLDKVNGTLAGYEGAGQPIPIPVMHLSYARFKPDAVSRNLLRAQNDQLFDVAGRTESPYTVRTAFAACPAIAYADYSSVGFILRPELFFTNTGKTLSSRQVDFGNGSGFVAVSWNTAVYANYTTTGVKRLVVRLTYTDGTVAESHSEFEVTRVTGGARYDPGAPGQPIAATNEHAGGTINVELSLNNRTGRIRRPLVFVEGYDVSSIAPDLETNYDYNDFIVNLRTTDNPELRFELDNIDSYDLIFLDYANGTDDIRRNAALLRDVLIRVNEEKRLGGSTEPNVIMAWSMGGLVARYALADMEKQRRTAPAAANDHQTRLLVTIDSPHRGANVPLGVQALAQAAAEFPFTFGIPGLTITTMAGDLIPGLRQAVRVFNAPATRQLLIHRTLAGPFPADVVVDNTFLDDEYRPMITFPATGPPPYEVAAISLGSECGTRVLTPYSELVRAAGNFFISPMPYTTRNNHKTEIVVNALPELGESRRISYLRVWSEYRVLGFININTTFYRRSFTSPPGLLPWDSAPGGTYPMQEQVAGRVPSINRNFLPIFQARLGVNVAESFSFIPTVSGIDATTIDNSTLTARYTNGTNPTNPARVNNFITQERDPVTGIVNRSHTNFFSNRNARWMLNEIRGGNPVTNCTILCGTTGPTVEGDAIVCTSASYATIAIPGARYIWTAGGNLRLTSQNANQAVFTADGSGSGTVSVRIESDCGNFTPPARSVQVNTSSLRIDSPSNPYGTTCPGESMEFVAIVGNGSAEASYYEWTAAGITLTGAQGQNTMTGIAEMSSGSVSVTITNACGTLQNADFYLSQRSGCADYLYALYPNPGSDYVEVAPDEAVADNPAKGKDFEVEIYDNFAQKKLSAKTKPAGKDKKLTLNVTSLPIGIYVIHIIHPEGRVQKSLEIMR